MDQSKFSNGLGAVVLTTALVCCFRVPLPAGVDQRLPTAIFSYDQHPDLPLRAYAAGRLGIVQPTYARSYLYVAYRWMKGMPLSGDEAEQLDRFWTTRLEGQTTRYSSEGPAAYDALRGSLNIPWQAPRKAKGHAQPQYLAPDYVYYARCADHSFATAADTLRARIERFGAQSREVAEWVRGQDFVFENCFGDGSGFLPPRAAPDVDPLIHADRDYQLAAALFYSSRFEEAASAFRRISVDFRSPWAPWGRYLSGRSLLWDARTQGEDSPAYEDKLQEAAAELLVASDADGPQEVRDAAQWLLARILMRNEPRTAAALLSARLMSPHGSATRAEDLTLFTQVLDTLAKDDGSLAAVRQTDGMADWIFTLQDQGENALEHALQRWRAEGSLEWLAAALAKIGPGHQAAGELLDAAAQLKDGPASPMIDYHRARLLTDRTRRDEARALLDDLLPGLQDLTSSRNRVLSLRAKLARDAEELLSFGARAPAFVSHVYRRDVHSHWTDQAYYSPWRLDRDARAQLGTLQGSKQWGPETADILNRAVPLDELARMGGLPGQPPELRTDLLRATWTRALLLERWDLVRTLAPEVGETTPSMREDLQALLAVAAPEQMRFFAANALLKTPGASVALRSGPIRTGPIYRVDPDGLNWWWVSPIEVRHTEFLSKEQRESAAHEWSRIDALGAGYPWLLQQVIEAAARPEQPQAVAAALYRAVACLDGISLRPAYQPWFESRTLRMGALYALKRHYPGTEWTKKAAQALEASRRQ